MSLVDDYLRAVAILLPKDQRDDIVAELRDTILNRIESREADLRRPLTDVETEALLREIGHPLVVAARYRGGPQHVVGPAIYPYWIFAVKIAVGLQLTLAAVVFMVRVASGGDFARAFGLATGSLFSGAMTLIGVATAAAWLIERNAVRIDYLDRWRVRDLKVLDLAAWDLDGLRGARAWRDGRRRWRTAKPWRDARRGRELAARGLNMLATGAVLVLWWLGVLKIDLVGASGDFTRLGIDPGDLATLDWRAFIASLFWPGLAYGLALVIQGALIIAQPRAVRLRGLLDLAIGAGVAATALWVWTSSPLSQATRVDSLTGLALRIESLFRSGFPVALGPVLTLTLALFVIGGVSRMGRGVADILATTNAPISGRSSPSQP